jgi:hypothetical protein
MRHINLPSAEQAAATALRALGFLVRDEERLERFCAMTGMDLAALREGAASAPVQIAVLDYLLSDESLLLIFTSEEGLPPDMPRLSRMRLSGEDV